MSDFNSSLPVRTENAGDVIAIIADSAVPTQQLKVEADGSINVNTTISSPVDLSASTLAALESITVQNGAGAAAVNIQDGGNSITVDATDLDIRDLTHTQDSIKIGDGTDFMAVNADGSINATVTATDLDVRDLSFATDKVDVSGSSVDVSATDLDIRDLSASQDSVEAWLKDASGNAFTQLNPLPVSVSDTIVGATEVLDFKQAVAVAANASDTHTYTVTAGKTMRLQKIVASASGKIKVEIKIGASLKVVLFNSTANPNVEYKFEGPQALAAATVIDVVITNYDKTPQDVYSTIEGYEV